MTATDWARVKANLVALCEVLSWAGQGEDLHLVPAEFAALAEEDQAAILEFFEGVAAALREARERASCAT